MNEWMKSFNADFQPRHQDYHILNVYGQILTESYSN